jgi:hypothetical protein
MGRFQIDIPEDAIKEIASRYYVTELALFGSVLGPEFGPDSDIDVLVTFEPDAPIGFMGMAALARQLSDVLGRKVDLVPKVGLKSRIRKPVLRSAQVIYER